MIKGFKIVLLSVTAAVIYGVLHDQVTARICVEYFTVGHERIFKTQDPTLLALGWGIVATWWVGLSLGIPLAVACRFGKKPKLEWRDIVRPLVTMLVISYVLAALFGIGYWLLNSSTVYPYHPLMDQATYRRFEAVHRAHITSYECGFVGGLILVLTSWYRRAKRERETALQAAPPRVLSA